MKSLRSLSRRPENGVSIVRDRSPCDRRARPSQAADGELDLAIRLLLFGIVALALSFGFGTFLGAATFDQLFSRRYRENFKCSGNVAEFVRQLEIGDRTLVIALRNGADAAGQHAERAHEGPDGEKAEEAEHQKRDRRRANEDISRRRDMGEIDFHRNTDEEDAGDCTCGIGDREIPGHVVLAEQNRVSE